MPKSYSGTRPVLQAARTGHGAETPTRLGTANLEICSGSDVAGECILYRWVATDDPQRRAREVTYAAVEDVVLCFSVFAAVDLKRRFAMPVPRKHWQASRQWHPRHETSLRTLDTP